MKFAKKNMKIIANKTKAMVIAKEIKDVNLEISQKKVVLNIGSVDS